jgi:hypothetical protein
MEAARSAVAGRHSEGVGSWVVVDNWAALTGRRIYRGRPACWSTVLRCLTRTLDASQLGFQSLAGPCAEDSRATATSAVSGAMAGMDCL